MKKWISPQKFGRKVRAFAFILAVFGATIFVVYLIAFAANTTIGNNISTSGALTVGGASSLASTLSVTSDIYASSTLQATGNTLLYGDVGIGATTSPSMDLSVQGNALISGNLTVEGNLKFSGATVLANASSTLFTVSNTLWVDNKLLVGTTTSNTRLSIQGNVLISGNLTSVANITATGTLTVSGTASSSIATALGVATTSPWGTFSVEANTVNPSFVVSNEGTAAPYLFVGGTGQSGKVGIGTSTPNKPLSVVGSIENISDANFPLTSLEIVGGGISTNALYFYISGRYAYVTDIEYDTLRVYDITVPGDTNVLTFMQGATVGADPQGVCVAGQYAYVQTGSTFEIFDISSPASLFRVSSISLGGTLYSNVYVSGRYAYVTNAGSDTLQVIDISDPVRPRIVSSVSTGVGSDPADAFVSGKYAYVTAYVTDKLLKFDISTSTPALVGSSGINGPAEVFVSGRYAYVASYDGNQFQVFDVSTSSPALAASVSTGAGSTPWNVWVSGRYAFVTLAGSNAIKIYDIYTPSSPQLIHTISNSAGNCDSCYGFSDLQVSGRYLYFLAKDMWGNMYLRAYDLYGLETTSAIIHSLEVGQLDVRNDISAQGQLVAGTGLLVGSGGILSSGPLAVSATTTPSSILGNLSVGTSTPYASLFVWGRTSDLGAAIFEVVDNASSTLFRILNTGRVGIATTSPSQTLSVQGDALISGNLTSVANITATGTLNVTGLSTFGNATATQLTVTNSAYLASAGGRVGIATTSPARLLSVQGDAIMSGDLQIASIKATGTIGIGSTTPYARLAIKATAGDATRLMSVASSSDDIYFEISSTGTTTIEQLQTGVLTFDTDAGVVTWIDMPVTSATAGTPMSYTAMIDASSTLTIYAESDGSGGVKNQRVGIASSSPAFTLSVVGNMGISGCIRGATTTFYDTQFSNCRDIAEIYLAGGDLEPGEIVSFALDKPSQLMRATKDKPQAITGIISTSPAVLFEGSAMYMGGGQTAGFYGTGSKAPLTLAGQVPVKVNLEGGEIKIGDPITISSEPGIGKKATSSVRIVGYALNDYSSPTDSTSSLQAEQNHGYVMVFLSLENWQAPAQAVERDSSLLAMIVDTAKSWLESMKIFIEDGLVRLQNLVAEKITTKKLCLEDICLDKAQLQALLHSAGIEPSVEEPLAESPSEESAPEPPVELDQPDQ